MRQEEILQFVFLFIFVTLIIVLVGSNFSKINFADTTNAASGNTTVANINIGNSDGVVWLNNSFLVSISGSNINAANASKIVFTSPSGNVITKEIDCKTFSSDCAFMMDPLTGTTGTWIAAVYFDGVELKRKEVTVKSLCGSANGGTFNVTKNDTANYCQSTALSNNLGLCTSPAAITSSTIIVGSNNKCQWNCSYGQTTESCYFYYKDLVSGVANECGSITSAYSLSTNDKLCSNGEVLGFNANKNDWTWTCFSEGTSPKGCKALKIVDGKCGIASEKTLSSAPTSDLCSSGNASSVTLSGENWTWSCGGLNNGKSVSCNANKIVSIDGRCGTSNGKTLSSIPTSDLCSSGNASSVTLSGENWTWSCAGSSGGQNISCSAKKSSAIVVLDASKISLTPSPVLVGQTVSVKIEDDTLLANVESLNLVAKPILSSLNNQISAVLRRCSSGGGFCGSFTAPDSAGEWSISLYSSGYENMQISALKTFVVTADSQIPVIGSPVISPSIVSAGQAVLVKVLIGNSTDVKSIKISLSPQNRNFALTNSSLKLGGCSDDASMWCGNVKIPNDYPGGSWTVKVMSYTDKKGNEKVISSNLESSFTVKVPCSYSYSDWGACNNGKKYRTVSSSSPDGCSESEKVLEEGCSDIPCSAYVYSDWGACSSGKRVRKLVSASPAGCLGNAILEEACSVPQVSCSEDKWECEPWQPCSSDNKQSRKCSLVFDCSLVSNSTPELVKSCKYSDSTQQQVNTNTDQPNQEPEQKTTLVVSTKADISLECSRENITDANTCQAYTSQMNIVNECLTNNINDHDRCKKYLLNKYPTLVKCQNLKESECENYINNVLLSDLKDTISNESNQKLVDSVGSVAVVNPQEKTIKVVDKSSGQSSDVKAENIPLSSANNNVSVKLVSTSNSDEQKYLSPVAITFDSNGNGISDDMEARLGSKIDTTKLTGVDKAIADGKSLEQPKFKKEALISGVLTVEKVDNSGNNSSNNIRFQGKATPNQLLTLFIYSTMPIVITVKADANGNWVYDLDKSLINGKHEAYVVINNSEGRILEASLPKPFFIDEARAVAMEEFVRIEDASSVSVPESSDSFIRTYVAAGLGFIALLIVIFLFIRSKAAQQEKE